MLIDVAELIDRMGGICMCRTVCQGYGGSCATARPAIVLVERLAGKVKRLESMLDLARQTVEEQARTIKRRESQQRMLDKARLEDIRDTQEMENS